MKFKTALSLQCLLYVLDASIFQTLSFGSFCDQRKLSWSILKMNEYKIFTTLFLRGLCPGFLSIWIIEFISFKNILKNLRSWRSSYSLSFANPAYQFTWVLGQSQNLFQILSRPSWTNWMQNTDKRTKMTGFTTL